MALSISKNVQPDKFSDAISLWSEFRLNPSASARERLIELHLPFARMLAAKAYAMRTYRELEFLDYLQYASIGLMESVDRFEPERGIKFETFATQRITGAILNGIESLSEKQEQVSARRRIVSERVKSLQGATPGEKEPNAVFGYLAELAIGLAVGFALEDSGMFHAKDDPAYSDNTYQSIELKQLRQRVVELLDSLPANEKKVIGYHYLQQLAFEEVAAILGVTKGRISQIHNSALKRLRNCVSNDGRIDLSC